MTFVGRETYRRTESQGTSHDPAEIFSIIFCSPLILFTRQVIGGDLQDRLMPVPFSKNTTDQAVSQDNKLFVSFLLLYAFGLLDTPVSQLQLALFHQRVFSS
mgnify:CR=1 FL=1